MRLILAMIMLGTSTYAVHAKDWGEMSGRERRLYVASYVRQNNMLCKYPPMTVVEQEKALAERSWIAVTIGMKLYCSAVRQAAVKK